MTGTAIRLHPPRRQDEGQAAVVEAAGLLRHLADRLNEFARFSYRGSNFRGFGPAADDWARALRAHAGYLESPEGIPHPFLGDLDVAAAEFATVLYITACAAAMLR